MKIIHHFHPGGLMSKQQFPTGQSGNRRFILCFVNQSVRISFSLSTLFLIATVLFFPGAHSVPAVTFDASQRISPLHQEYLAGTCLPVFNPPTVYDEIKQGLVFSRYALMRFPNGTLSNEYHWNGRGAFDSTGIWHPDTTADSTGFLSTNLYCGTTSSNWGTTRYSRVTDGDTATFWWSDPLITKSSPYIYLSWPDAQKIDSVRILWGERYSRNFEVQVWDGPVSPPGPHQMNESKWITIYTDTAGSGTVTAFACSTRTTHALRVISYRGSDGSDVQIREIFVYSEGTRVTSNTPKQASQTPAYALSTHPGCEPDQQYLWDFERFMAYLDTLGYPAVPVICVNYGTGTPEEAAAWVHFANNVKKFNIRYWQIGNEMDGQWEIGGPVNAYTYAEKYILFVKAMKAVDPDIKILGPVVSSPDRISGEYDGKSWLESVLYKVGEAEKKDSCTYIDGIDFHSYPYWPVSEFDLQDMALASDFVFNHSDSMLAWINRYLYNPESTLVMFSEYNASVIMSSALKQPINGIVNANLNAGLAQKFGYRAMSVIWDSWERGAYGADNTHGSLSLFNEGGAAFKPSWNYAPSSAFWGNFMVTCLWLDPDKENYLIASDAGRNGRLRYYGNATGNDARVLVLNLSTTDTSDVDVTMNGVDYSKVEIYSWGPREFTMIGTKASAYAMPGCGPSSSVVNASDLGTPKIAPSSAMVLRFFNADSGSSQPERVVWASLNTRPGPGDTIFVSASYRVAAGTITSISEKIDTAGFSPLEPLDGAFDGSYENSFFTIDSRTLGEGDFSLIIRAESNTGDTCFDTLALKGYLPVVNMPPVRASAPHLTIGRQASGRVAIRYQPEAQETAGVKIYSLRGVLLDERLSVTPGAPVSFIWEGSSVKRHPVVSGVFIVKAGPVGSNRQIVRTFQMVK